MPPITLSILVPVYNEARLITGVLERVVTAPASDLEEMNIRQEVILVDDGSRDGSCAAIERYIALHYKPRTMGADCAVCDRQTPIHLVRHTQNRGKGAAIRTALAHATGEFCIIQDADFEYDPSEYAKLLRPLLANEADIVFGSRFATTGERQVLRFWHSRANRVLTNLCSMAANLDLSDALTCFKAFRTATAQSMPLRSERFGIEAELTIKFAKRRARFCEVPISYCPRTNVEGKKIRARDALGILWAICRSWARNDLYADKAAAMLGAMEHAPRFNGWMAGTLRPFMGERVLEIGAGIGNLTRLLCANQTCYVVSDVDRHHVSQLKSEMRFRSNVSVVACDLENSEDFRRFERSMDTAICINVLEHIRDDLSGLRNLHSALAPGGRAIVLVPQGESVYGTMDETLGHCRRYATETLESRMREAGFRVERIIEFNRITYPGWFLNGRILRRRSVSRMQLWLFDLLVPFWRCIDAFLPWPPTSLIAIGTRVDHDAKT